VPGVALVAIHATFALTNHHSHPSRRERSVLLLRELAAGLSPMVWVRDERTRALRRLIARRRGVVKRSAQIKNEAQAILHRNLIERPKVGDRFAPRGEPEAAAAAGIHLRLPRRTQISRSSSHPRARRVATANDGEAP
jgi:hypothetical protein